MNRTILRASLLLSAVTLGALSCDKDKDIVSYQAPKDVVSTPPAAAGDAEPAVAPVDSSANGAMSWTLPLGWKQVAVPDTGAMFKPDFAFSVSNDEPNLLLTISHLGAAPMAGSLLPNVNRWGGQLGMPPVAEADLPKYVTPVQIGDVTAQEVDLENAGKRTIGAVIGHGDATWYLKLSGSSASLAGQKMNFDAFLSSVRFASATPQNADAVAGPPAPGADAGQGISSGVAGISWQLPSGWTAEPGDGFRLATLHPNGNGETIVKVSKFASLAGGAGLNVSRWRGEVGLDPVDDAHADAGATMTLGGRPWTVHDYTGSANGGRRLIVASFDAGGETWFFKLSGPTAAVSDAKADFEAFLGSIKSGS